MTRLSIGDEILWDNFCHEKRHVFNFFLKLGICQNEYKTVVDNQSFRRIDLI